MGMHQQVNILMVDDQPSKLMSYEVMLGELGENLIKAQSGREALEILLKTDVAVVLMDVSMPELDGFELADMIRQHPRFQKLAIIFISAVHLTDLDRLKGYQRGAVDYISVPVIPELLRAKVSVFAELHRRAQQLEALNRELRRLSSSLILMQDEERRRIARELHDTLLQGIQGLILRFQAAAVRIPNSEPARQLMDSALDRADEVMAEGRDRVRHLRVSVGPTKDLAKAFTQAGQELSRGTNVEFAVVVEGDVRPLHPLVLDEAYWIGHEALVNAFQHAEGTRIEVEIAYDQNKWRIRVRDNGRGIDSQVLKSGGKPDHWGHPQRRTSLTPFRGVRNPFRLFYAGIERIFLCNDYSRYSLTDGLAEVF